MNRHVRLGPVIFRDPVLLCGLLYLALFWDASGFLRLGLLAAVLHEGGHILIYCLLFHRFPVIEVNLTGFCMRTRGQAMTPGQKALLAAAGPAVNLLLAGGLGAEAGTAGDRPGQCLLGSQCPDRGIQSAAHPSAGRGRSWRSFFCTGSG